MNPDGQRGRAPSISIDVQRSTVGHTVVHLIGDLIGDAAAAIHHALVGQLSRAPQRLIVNLSEISRVDAGGVEALASVAAVAGEGDHYFCLVDGEAGRVRAALAAERLTDLFEIFSSVNEAVHDAG